MTSHRPSRPPAGLVAVLGYDGMSAFEAGIVAEVFGWPWPDLDVPRAELLLVSEHPGRPLELWGGGSFTTTAGLDALAGAGTVVVPSVRDIEEPASPEVVAALRRAAADGARMVSICSGAFALAEAGLLDGRRATTHWAYAARLAERYPLVEVDPVPLYVEDEGVFTSAGASAGIDLSLHLLRLDHGAEVANAVARRMVASPHRGGGQAQYVESPVTVRATDDVVLTAQQWALEHLDQPCAVADLAAAAGASQRTLLRRFTESVGASPARWVARQRVLAAVPLLEGGDTPVEEIARAVGFADVQTFRGHVRRELGTTPTAYRRQFQTRDPGGGPR